MEPEIRVYDFPIKIAGYCVSNDEFDFFTTKGERYKVMFRENDRMDIFFPEGGGADISIEDFEDGRFSERAPLEVLSWIHAAIMQRRDVEDDGVKGPVAKKYTFHGLCGQYTLYYAEESDELALMVPPLLIAGTKSQFKDLLLFDVLEERQLIRWISNVRVGKVAPDKKKKTGEV